MNKNTLISLLESKGFAQINYEAWSIGSPWANTTEIGFLKNNLFYLAHTICDSGVMIEFHAEMANLCEEDVDNVLNKFKKQEPYYIRFNEPKRKVSLSEFYAELNERGFWINYPNEANAKMDGFTLLVNTKLTEAGLGWSVKLRNEALIIEKTLGYDYLSLYNFRKVVKELKHRAEIWKR